MSVVDVVIMPDATVLPSMANTIVPNDKIIGSALVAIMFEGVY